MIEIVYHRPPGRTDTFRQRLVSDRPDCKITLLDRYRTETPLRVDRRIILEDGSPIIWFVFPGAWYDVGRFHRRDGRFTGFYTNLIAPAEIRDHRWEIHDLFLDVWLAPDRDPLVLDRDEFDQAVARGWIDAATADRALRELDTILERSRTGRWPPAPVPDIDLQRARALGRAGPGPAAGAP